MHPEPDHAPELDNAAQRRATDTLAHILGCAVLTGQEREPGAAPPADSFTERPTPLARFARVETFADRAPAPQRLTSHQSDRIRRQEIAEERRAEREQRARPAPGRFTVLDLQPHDCRFAAGEDLLFCGAPVVTGCSWCAAHRVVVYRERVA